jgi:hypothetical protein
MRIAKFVAEQTNAPLIHDPGSANFFKDTRFDVLFVKYGMLKFSNHREEALRIHERAYRVVNMENDYTFVPDKRFRKADETWSTVEKRTRYVNWNVLTRWPPELWSVPWPMQEPTRPGVLYYGAHREGRQKYFKLYFGQPSLYPVTISTYRGRKAFEATCGNGLTFVGPMSDPAAPADWLMTIYAEDEASHSLYCSPANRFYECVQCGLAQAIDAKAVNTLLRAGVKNADKFAVCDQSDVLRLMLDWRKVRDAQRRLWHRDYMQELKSQFWNAVRASFGGE